MVGLTPEEAVSTVVKLAREGVPPSKIGLILRDQHGVPDVKKLTGKSIKQIMDSAGVKSSLPEDLANVIKEAVRLYAHLSKHKKDTMSYRALERVESRINRLSRYYKRIGVLPKEWRYDRERAALLVKG
ncbi:MAG: 30S ribosomal protein S15 [Candidatus Hadarchaeales archaeon]